MSREVYKSHVYKYTRAYIHPKEFLWLERNNEKEMKNGLVIEKICQKSDWEAELSESSRLIEEDACTKPILSSAERDKRKACL